MSTVVATRSPAETASAAMSWREPRLVRRYATRFGVTAEEAEACFAALCQFLVVCAAADEPRAPSCEVDEMWHIALLFSRAYHDFCEQRLGRFIHHEPLDGPADEELYAATRAQAQALFGKLDERFWPDPESAPRCGSMYVP